MEKEREEEKGRKLLGSRSPPFGFGLCVGCVSSFRIVPCFSILSVLLKVVQKRSSMQKSERERDERFSEIKSRVEKRKMKYRERIEEKKVV